MNSIVVTSTKQNIKFGYEGEDNVTKIIFPYDESWLEYGEGNFEVRILRCGDEVAYTATEVVDDRQAMTLTMTVTDIELSVRGRGEMQLCYVCPDSIKKSPIYQYTVNRSVDYKYAVDPPEGSIIASVEKSLSEIKNTTNRLSNSVISIESSIDDVNSQIDNINDKISEFDEEIDSIGEVETRVDNLETSIQSINVRINTAEGNINENAESISDLNESVTELENRKVTDLETSGGRSDSGKYLTVGTDGKIKATSLTIPPTITVDASLSTTSTNPVQNKVIKTELNNINSNIETCNTEISKLNGSLGNVQNTIDSIIKSNPPIEKYLYKEDTYITTSGVETALPGYDTYKIPVSSGDILLIKQTNGLTAFYDGINTDVVYHLLNNNSYERVYVAGAGSHPNYYFYPNTAVFRSQFKVLAGENVTAALMTVKRGNTDMVSVQHNDAVMVLSDTGKIDYRNTIVTLDDNNTLASNIYKTTTNMLKLADGYTVHTYRVLSGEKVVIPAKATGINYYGFFINSSTLEISQITDAVFTVQADGFVETFAYSSDNIVITVYPAKSISIDYSAIKNIPVSENPFTGLSAVAFGTSITYRGQEGQSGGYLQYLPGLSGMTFDNQGIGNSTILGDMLTAIKTYTGYADKNVCTLEGFVNDWFQGKPLGTYTDETEDTVCGCVRSAINYMLSQNKHMTMFLILDHYGRVYGTTDCSTTAKNSNNQTQYQYYEEIAKVAESLAIPVIKLYAESQISENTGLNMYLVDNIHPTALGAKQDAYTIWAKMRTYFPNQQLS